MNIRRVTTERVEPGPARLVVAANIEGDDLTPRAVPVLVRFGRVSARHVVPLATGEGVRAVFADMPPAGATLFIGRADEPLAETRFKFTPPGDFPVG